MIDFSLHFKNDQIISLQKDYDSYLINYNIDLVYDETESKAGNIKCTLINCASMLNDGISALDVCDAESDELAQVILSTYDKDHYIKEKLYFNGSYPNSILHIDSLEINKEYQGKNLGRILSYRVSENLNPFGIITCYPHPFMPLYKDDKKLDSLRLKKQRRLQQYWSILGLKKLSAYGIYGCAFENMNVPFKKKTRLSA